MKLSVKSSALLLMIIALYTAPIASYSTFQMKIPNGLKVPNPCHASAIWQGVGHLNPAGGGVRNQFGLDFHRLNYNWTAICPLDSDGDNKTNGEELGDPTCTWQPGMPSPVASIMSHPGVCEPLNSPACAATNSWLTCRTFNCSATKQQGVRTLSLRIPPTSVPSAETTYMCMGFTLPNDTDYHVIAMEPIINTSQILHHMLLFVCKDPLPDPRMFSHPWQCNMGANNCLSLIGLWGVGTTGQCLANSFGFHIGAAGYKYAVLQLHWNNPSHSANFVDSSGMAVYFTPNLRPNSGEILMVGQTSLVIPPGQPSVSFQGTCTEYCTSALRENLYITDATLHMHLLGKKGDIQLRRNGALNTVLVDVNDFDYNDPPFIGYDTPVVLRPGDEIRVDCTYRSTHKNTTTYFGEGTSDEMCFGFITYYPAQEKFTYCNQWRSIETCDNVPIKCDMTALSKLSKYVPIVCGAPRCSRACKMMMTALESTGCITGDMALLISQFESDVLALSSLLQWCNSTETYAPATTPNLNHLSASGSTMTTKTVSTTVALTVLLSLMVANAFSD